jgi:hypothetical protein
MVGSTVALALRSGGLKAMVLSERRSTSVNTWTSYTVSVEMFRVSSTEKESLRLVVKQGEPKGEPAHVEATRSSGPPAVYTDRKPSAVSNSPFGARWLTELLPVPATVTATV